MKTWTCENAPKFHSVMPLKLQPFLFYSFFLLLSCLHHPFRPPCLARKCMEPTKERVSQYSWCGRTLNTEPGLCCVAIKRT